MVTAERIRAEVGSWPGVATQPGNFGATAFVVGKRELGHLHGDRTAHFAFPKRVATELREQGRVGPHPVFPDSVGMAARSIESEADVDDVIALLRLNYDRIAARYGTGGVSDPPPAGHGSAMNEKPEPKPDNQQDEDGTPRPPHPDADPATTPDVHGDPETPI